MPAPVRPSRVNILFAYVALMVALVLMVSPGELLLWEGNSLKIPVWADLTDYSTASPAQVNPSVRQWETRADELDKEQSETPPSADQPAELLPSIPDITVKDTPAESRILYPESEEIPLWHFFTSLHGLVSGPDSSRNRLVRVLHYGDSQLEGDRITEHLRNRLQQQFGGCGVGLVPITETQNIRSTIDQSASENWRKYAIYGEYPTGAHRVFGLLGSYYRFARHQQDSIPPGWTSDKAWVQFRQSKYSTMKLNNRFEQVRVWYRSQQEMSVSYLYNSVTKGTDTLPPAPEPAWHTLSPTGDFQNLRLSFETRANPDVLGISFDCLRGVAVDNIAFRGSSGTDFSKIDRTALQRQLADAGVRLIILQFGVNVVPSVLTNYDYYENQLYQQLRLFKTLAPQADLLVVGVSDMARKRGPRMESYPNLDLVRQAQKNAAFRAGCAFWDLYAAMGGKNSMEAWVNAEPPLAQKDYTHFTRQGARLVAEMLYNELMRDYLLFAGGS